MSKPEIAPEVLEKLKLNNPILALRYLLAGREWEQNGHKYVLSEDMELCVIATVDKAPNWEQHLYKDTLLLRTDITLQGFIKMAMDMSEEDSAIMAANLTITELSKYRK